MGDNTKIQWCDDTYNPWLGCTKVSAGCLKCYAERHGRRFGVKWGPGMERRKSSAATRNAPLRWAMKPWVCECGQSFKTKHGAYGHALGWKVCEDQRLHRRRVFLGSMMDLLDPEVPVEWLAEALDVVRRTPELDWLLLSKRWELWERRFWAAGSTMLKPSCMAKQDANMNLLEWMKNWADGNPPSNVTILSSVEEYSSADERITHLMRVPAARRGLSIEPLIGPVDLTSVRWRTQNDHHGNPQHDHFENVLIGVGKVNVPKIDWVIVGGETGPGARPCNVEWIRSIIRQCREVGVPCFVKQWGSNPDSDNEFDASYAIKLTGVGSDPSEWPEDLRVREFPDA